MMADNTLSDLRDALVDAYPELPRAQELAERAGIIRGTLPPNLPMRDWWWQAIQEFQRQEKLLALVEYAASDPTVAAFQADFERLRNLIAQRQGPAVPAIQPDLWVITEPIRMELVRVQAGEFLMGTTDEQIEDMLKRFAWASKYHGWFKHEQPAIRVDTDPFAIGRYPVTNAQYAVFAKATGREVHLSGEKDHPVVNVSWEDAMAFTEWLSRQTRVEFRLPTEAEWEKAARGTDGRVWPWGNDWDAKRANTEEGGPGGTTPVGAYSPEGDSPYNCADMAGNVGEWCRTKWRDNYTIPADSRATVEVVKVVRGGSWAQDQKIARCADRHWLSPDNFGVNVGFRVAHSLDA